MTQPDNPGQGKPADARADVDQVAAGAALAAAAADAAAAKTSDVQTSFSETGHAQLSDTNVQELISGNSGLLSTSAATLKAGLDGVALARATNAAVLDNIVSSNSAFLNNLVNSASHRHSEIAADRQWNLNETDFFAFVTAAVAAAVAKNAEGE